MGFLDKEIKDSIANEMASENRRIEDATQAELEAFRSDENLGLLVDKTGDLVRQAYKLGKSSIGSVTIDMSVAYEKYSFTQEVAIDQLCKSALLTALQLSEPKTAAINLVYRHRQTDYHDFVTDRWISVTFDPPLS